MMAVRYEFDNSSLSKNVTPIPGRWLEYDIALQQLRDAGVGEKNHFGCEFFPRPDGKFDGVVIVDDGPWRATLVEHGWIWGADGVLASIVFQSDPYDT